MKLKLENAGKRHDVTIRRDGRNVYAEIDGRAYKAELHDLANGEYLLIADARPYHCVVETTSASAEICDVHLRGQTYSFRIVDPKRMGTTHMGHGMDHGAAQIIAPMPGRVVRTLTEVGAEVQAGAGILVVEAMKMQNEMKAPKKGVLVSLSVKAGATVNAGDVLAVIE